MSVRAVIFDIDGTLIDTNGSHVQAWQEAFRKHGHNVPPERISPEIGKGGDKLVPTILGDEGERREGDALRKAHTVAFLRIAKEHHFRVFPAVRELLADLKRRGARTALATSSKDEQMKAVEKSAGIDLKKLADLVVTASQAGESKPAPDLVLAALHKLGLPAKECLMIGDTAFDAEAARKAGVASVGLLCGGCSSEPALHKAGASAVYRDPADVLQHLDEVLAG